MTEGSALRHRNAKLRPISSAWWSTRGILVLRPW